MQKFKKITWFIQEAVWALICLLLGTTCLVGFMFMLNYMFENGF